MVGGLLWSCWGLFQPLAGHLLPMCLFIFVPYFILIFSSLIFCPLYRSWHSHCSVLRVDGECSLVLPSLPRCHSHHRFYHSHHWGTLMQQAPPSLPLSSCKTCHSGWCLNFAWFFTKDFVSLSAMLLFYRGHLLISSLHRLHQIAILLEILFLFFCTAACPSGWCSCCCGCCTLHLENGLVANGNDDGVGVPVGAVELYSAGQLFPILTLAGLMSLPDVVGFVLLYLLVLSSIVW